MIALLLLLLSAPARAAEPHPVIAKLDYETNAYAGPFWWDSEVEEGIDNVVVSTEVKTPGAMEALRKQLRDESDCTAGMVVWRLTKDPKILEEFHHLALDWGETSCLFVLGMLPEKRSAETLKKRLKKEKNVFNRLVILRSLYKLERKTEYLKQLRAIRDGNNVESEEHNKAIDTLTDLGQK